MTTAEQLALYAPGILAGLAVTAMCGVLSVLVVVKKLGFVGQGVSHSAFGGIGVAAILAAMGLAPGMDESGLRGQAQMGIVVLFCIAAAVGMGLVSRRRGGGDEGVSEDTAIGLFLVGSMALGAVLVQVAREMAQRGGGSGTVQSWESILFGSVLLANSTDAWVSWSVALAVAATAWLVRRPLAFWALDEDSARAFGVNGRAMQVMLMVMLALAVVVAMKVAGVVLATALLVLPGATALRLSEKMGRVIVLSVTCGMAALLAGVWISVRWDWQAGPSVVLVMTAMFVAAMAAGWVRRAV